MLDSGRVGTVPAPLLGESSQRRARGSSGEEKEALEVYMRTRAGSLGMRLGEEEGAGGYCGWYIISELEVCFLMVDGLDVGQSFSPLA